MKVLVIPDVHLKPWMFQQAAALMRQEIAECAVCLMDLADDWNRQFDTVLYEKTYDEAVRFAKRFPKTKWCYGNHDLSYVWGRLETGYSSMAAYTVQKKLLELKEAAGEENPVQYVQRIDHVLFSHGGVSEGFVKEYIGGSRNKDADAVLQGINKLGPKELWQDESPIWLRPQCRKERMYRPRTYLQVVGHTPVEKIKKEGSVISCDVFSTDRTGKPIGTEEFLLLDTLTWEFCGIKV